MGVGERGRVTIPKEIRERFGIGPATEVEFRAVQGAIVMMLDLLLADETFCELSTRAIEEAATEGALTICDLLYAELCVHFRTQKECNDFPGSSGIRVERLTREAQFRASRASKTYRAQGGQRRRILADFSIGAHAEVQAGRLLSRGQLLSRDRGFYRKLFPRLKLVDPSRG